MNSRKINHSHDLIEKFDIDALLLNEVNAK